MARHARQAFSRVDCPHPEALKLDVGGDCRGRGDLESSEKEEEMTKYWGVGDGVLAGLGGRE